MAEQDAMRRWAQFVDWLSDGPGRRRREAESARLRPILRRVFGDPWPVRTLPSPPGVASWRKVNEPWRETP